MADFNIMSLFSGGQQPAQQPAPAAPANPAPQQDPGSVPALNNQGTPQNQNSGQQHQVPAQNPTGAAAGDESPLDQFKDLFNIAVDPNAKPEDPNSAWFDLDQTKMMEAAGKVSFTNVPEFKGLAEKALQGDVEAFSQVLNTVMQAGYVRNAMLAGTISEKAGRTALDKIGAELPKRIRDVSSSESTSALKPEFKHQALQPVVEAVRKQVMQKYPDASSKEIAEMTNNYLSAVSKQLTTPEEPLPADRRKADLSAGSDFSDFFS